MNRFYRRRRRLTDVTNGLKREKRWSCSGEPQSKIPTDQVEGEA